jgi:arylformamidase
MSNAIVFRDYGRAALDAQYDNRAAVPEHVEHVARWQRDSQLALSELEYKLDVAYGSGSAETLDVFAAGTSKPAPVQVFFHGGYWMSRDKADFRFLARAFWTSWCVNVVGRSFGYIATRPLLVAIPIASLSPAIRRAVTW